MKPLRPGTRPYLFFVTALTATGVMTTDLYLPSLPEVMKVFATDVSSAQLTLSAFTATFAMAQLLYGPLSDAFGRRLVLLVGFALYVAATILCTFAPSIGYLIGGRALQALGACVGPVMARAVVRDTYPVDGAATVLAAIAVAMAVAPAVAPTAGGVLQEAFGWQASFKCLIGFGLALMMLVALFFEETNQTRSLSALAPGALFSTYRTLLKDRVFMGNCLTLSLSFAAFFAFLSGSSFVLIGVLGVSPHVFGLCFAVTVFGALSGSVVSARFGRRLGDRRLVRLAIGMGLIGGAVLTGLALAHVQTVAAVVVPMAVCHFSGAMLAPSCTAAALAPHPRVAGTASAVLGFIQMGSGAVSGWLVGLLDNGTTLPMAAFVGGFWVLTAASYAFLIEPRQRRAAR